MFYQRNKIADEIGRKRGWGRSRGPLLLNSARRLYSIGTFQRFVKNLGLVYSVNTINGILGVISVPLAVHFLGASGYGIYSIYTVLAAYAALIDLGITKNLSRTLAGEVENQLYREHLKTSLGLYIMISGVLFLLLPFIMYFTPIYLFPVQAEYVVTIRWIVALSVLEYIIGIPVAMMQALCVANERFDRYSLFGFMSGLSRYGLMFAGILIFHDPKIVVLLIVGRRLIDFFTARKIMGNLPSGSWTPSFDLRSFKSVVGNSVALSFAQLFQTTVISVGTVFVNSLFGLEALGIYRSAFDLANKVWFFSNGVGLVVFPRFVQSLKDQVSRRLLFSHFPTVFSASWAGYTMLSGIGAIAAPLLLGILGLRLPVIQNLFVVLLLGVTMNAHANLSYEFLQATGRYWVAVGLSLVALILMVGSFYGLYTSFGIMAIGWSWVISQVIYAIIADNITLYEARFSKREQVFTLFSKLSVFFAGFATALGCLGYFPMVVAYTCVGAIAIIFVRSLMQLRVHRLLLKRDGG
jgi:O-antigen/teichoic acid export membrane protein